MEVRRSLKWRQVGGGAQNTQPETKEEVWILANTQLHT